MNQDNPCYNRQEPYCYYYRICPECLGSTIHMFSVIFGIQAPNYFGLQHPCDLVCQTCKGVGRTIVDIRPNYDGDFEYIDKTL